MKRKRDYARERREAKHYADTLPALTGLSRKEWLDGWALAFNGYLAGMRRRAQGKEVRRE